MSGEIENRIAQSGLITINLEEWIHGEEFSCIDIKPILWQGMALRESDLRQFIKESDPEMYIGKWIYFPIPNEVILPQWAHLLLGVHFGRHCKAFYIGDLHQAKEQCLLTKIQQLDISPYQDARVIIKGCTGEFVTARVQMELLQRILPVVKSLMFGEPCSTVPLFKRK
jgi:hypothetical protein